MSRKIYKNTAVKLTLLCLLVGFFSFFVTVRVAEAFTYKAPDQPAPGAPNCVATVVNRTGTASVGNGYEYVTYSVGSNYPVSPDNFDLGGTFYNDCSLTRSNTLTYKGLVADQVWEGTTTPSAAPYNATSWTGGGFPAYTLPCAPPDDYSPPLSKCQGSNMAFYQDDAGAIAINCTGVVSNVPACSPGGKFIWCLGMSGADDTGGAGEFKWSACPGADIYHYGVAYGAGDTLEPPGKPCPVNWGEPCIVHNPGIHIAYAGAGYVNIGAPVNLTPIVGTAADGFLNDFKVKMWFRNTWPGGYGGSVLMTMRYPERDDTCAATTGSLFLPPGGTATVGANFTNTGQENWMNTYSLASDPRKNFAANATSSSPQLTITTLNPAPMSVDTPKGGVSGFSYGIKVGLGAPLGATYTLNFRMQLSIFGTATPFGPSFGCPITVTVGSSSPTGTQPYLSIYGGDAYAGGGFIVGSGCDNDGDIKTFVNPTKPTLGSGAQFAAFAMGQLYSPSNTSAVAPSDTDFNTAQQTKPPYTPPSPPHGLVFANTPAGTLGNFTNGGTGNCIDNTFITTGSAVPGAPTTTPISGWGSGVYYYNGGGGTLTIKNGASHIPNGTSITIYANSDVIINNDITYDSTTWTKPSDIPQVKLVAKGNIYINFPVHNLDGIFEAFPTNTATPSNGYIYTCSNLGTPEDYSLPNFATQCNNTLTVHGKLLAQGIVWARAKGDVGALTGVDSTDNPYGIPGTANTQAAEDIIDGPESYIGGDSSVNYGTYDAITSLPPVL